MVVPIQSGVGEGHAVAPVGDVGSTRLSASAATAAVPFVAGQDERRRAVLVRNVGFKRPSASSVATAALPSITARIKAELPLWLTTFGSARPCASSTFTTESFLASGEHERRPAIAFAWLESTRLSASSAAAAVSRSRR